MSFKLKWPIDSDKIIEHFSQNTDYWKDFTYQAADGTEHALPGNDGISIEAPFKGTVTACADGTVAAVDTPGDVRPNGNTVTIEHSADGTTYTTTYCHLLQVDVQAGQAVKAGDAIGLADSTGSVIGSALKLIVRKTGATAAGETAYTTTDGRSINLLNDTVDPADYLDPAPAERLTVPPGPAVSVFNDDDVRVRMGPGTNFRILFERHKGDKVEVLGVSEDKEWYNIQIDGGTAWTYATFVDYAGDPASLPTVEYVIQVPITKPDHPLRGMHDGAPQWGDSAAAFMFQQGTRGWAVDMVYCESEDNLDKLYTKHSLDYTPYEAKGIRVILRWNYSYAKSEGGGGTFGDPSNDKRLIQWIARGIKSSKGVWGHIIGNEPNRAGENHDYGSNGIGTPITAKRIADLVKGVKAEVGQEHRIAPPAFDGTNTEAWFAYGRDDQYLPHRLWSDLIDLLDVGDCDWIALHGYGRGSLDDPANDQKFGPPLENQFYGFRMWETFADILRQKGPEWERLPIVITETNHLRKGGRYSEGHPIGWDNDVNGVNWISKAYEYVRQWNNKPNDQYVHGLVLYRLSQDEWHLNDKGLLIQAMKDNGENPL